MEENNDRDALVSALKTIARSPEQEKLHQVATDTGNAEAIADLRELVNGDFARLKVEDESEPAVTVDQKEKSLSPEETEKILSLLKSRFEAKENKGLCPGIEWTKIESAFSAEDLLCAHTAEAAGHKPTIFQADNEGFWFGSSLSQETPSSSRNCVYDEKTAERLREDNPDIKSAEKSAEDMGFVPMTTEQGNHVAKNTNEFYEDGWSWYNMDEESVKTGDALAGARFGDYLLVDQDLVNYRFDDRGWRGARRVYWTS